MIAPSSSSKPPNSKGVATVRVMPGAMGCRRRDSITGVPEGRGVLQRRLVDLTGGQEAVGLRLAGPRHLLVTEQFVQHERRSVGGGIQAGADQPPLGIRLPIGALVGEMTLSGEQNTNPQAASQAT